jgi:hypothetical protein
LFLLMMRTIVSTAPTASKPMTIYRIILTTGRPLPPRFEATPSLRETLPHGEPRAAGGQTDQVPLSGQPLSFDTFFMFATPALISFSSAFRSTSSSLLM